MLDDIAVGPILEQPARKDAIPFIVALFLNRQLHERPGFGRRFPRRRGFAGTQADDDAADPRTVTGPHLQIADQPVTFVEQRDHGPPFRHRSRPDDTAGLLRHSVGAADFGLDLGNGAPPVGCLIAPGERHQQRRRKSGAKQRHSAPGRHAS